MTIWCFWISDCKYVLLLVEVFAIDCSNVEFCEACVRVRACVCVREREREREREGHITARQRLNRGLFANTYELHHCVCHATLFPFRAWTDGKIINCLYIHFESWSSRLWKGALHFRRVFGQCTGSVGQSVQTALVGRRDFVEKEAFERGGA